MGWEMKEREVKWSEVEQNEHYWSNDLTILGIWNKNHSSAMSINM